MANLLSSFLEKLKLKPLQPMAPAPTPASEVRNEATALKNADLELDPLTSMDDAHLKEHVSRQSERTVIRILQALTDTELQLRVIQSLDNEGTLKRISRSELSKKLKRAAEKKLRETGSGAAGLKIEKLGQLSQRVQAFLATRRWPEAQSDAQDLLSLVSAPELTTAPVDAAHPQVALFESLRKRLKAEIAEYEKTLAGLEAICLELESPQPLSGGSLGRIQAQWNDLEEKYSFSKDSELHQKYSEALRARSQARTMATPTPTPRTPEPIKIAEPETSRPKTVDARPGKSEPSAEELAQREQKKQAERDSRIETLKKLRERIQKLGENLANRHAGAQLRDLQKEVQALKRWKREFPTELDEAEAALKTLSSKRTEVINEVQWSTWARTDLATRIQTELEKTIGEIEAETDQEAAIKRSAGLGPRLFDYAKEMRELGSLDRSKDHKIWEQFKSLSDRGWMICDRMRPLVLEKLKTIVNEHAPQPLEYTAAVFANPRLSLNLKPAAFEESVQSAIRELHALWRDIGSKPTEANRETETVGSKLFEAYFRQFNLQAGKQQRKEADALQRKRSILAELKSACEGQSSLLSRLQVAKRFGKSWLEECANSPLPENLSSELLAELEGYQNRLNTELAGEFETQKNAMVALEVQAQEILDKILAKTGANLSQALKTVSSLESDLISIEKQVALFAGLKQSTPQSAEPSPAETSWPEARDHLKKILEACRNAANQETSERASKRNQVILEAQALALSQEWESSRARFEELRALWKKVGVLGQSQDATFDLLLENIWQFYLARAASVAGKPLDDSQKAAALKTRSDLLYSLDALTRFQDSKSKNPAPLALPFNDEERAKSSGKVLELGLKYRQILALDPQAGILKETKKIMEQWARLGASDDGRLPDFWRVYLDRVHWLLGLPAQALSAGQPSADR